MPSKSPAQHRLMEAVAHNPAFAKKVGIPVSVGQDFAAADRQGYQTGGVVKALKILKDGLAELKPVAPAEFDPARRTLLKQGASLAARSALPDLTGGFLNSPDIVQGLNATVAAPDPLAKLDVVLKATTANLGLKTKAQLLATMRKVRYDEIDGGSLYEAWDAAKAAHAPDLPISMDDLANAAQVGHKAGNPITATTDYHGFPDLALRSVPDVIASEIPYSGVENKDFQQLQSLISKGDTGGYLTHRMPGFENLNSADKLRVYEKLYPNYAAKVQTEIPKVRQYLEDAQRLEIEELLDRYAPSTSKRWQDAEIAASETNFLKYGPSGAPYNQEYADKFGQSYIEAHPDAPKLTGPSKQQESKGALKQLEPPRYPVEQLLQPGEAGLAAVGYADGGAVEKPYFGNPHTTAQGRKAKLQDTGEEGLLEALTRGLMGQAPDEYGSVLDPAHAANRGAANVAYGLGTAAMVAPLLRGVKGALSLVGTGPVGRSAQRGVIKAPGGNWDKESVDNALTQAMGYTQPIEAYAKNQELGEVGQWTNKNLRNYLTRDLATERDPVRKLLLEHPEYAPQALEGQNMVPSPALAKVRAAAGFPKGGSADIPRRGGPEQGYDPVNDAHMSAAVWDTVADRAAVPETVKQYLMEKYGSSIPRELAERTQFDPADTWMLKADPNTPIHSLRSRDLQNLGFPHIVDELENAVDAGGQLKGRGLDALDVEDPGVAAFARANLHIDPDKIGRMSVADAVAHVGKIDKWRAEQEAVANPQRANSRAAHTLKEYPEQGLKWVELKLPKDAGTFEGVDATPEAYGAGYKDLEDALRYEGAQMKHCVGGYCDDVAGGDTRILSLRDATGKPHATVELEKHDALNSWVDQMPRRQYEIYEEEFRTKHPEFEYRMVNSPEWVKFLTEEKNAPTLDNFNVNQIKGPANGPVKPEYQQHVLDLLNGGVPGLDKGWGTVQDLNLQSLYNTAHGVEDFMPHSYNAPRNVRQLALGRARQEGALDPFMTREGWEAVLKPYVEKAAEELSPEARRQFLLPKDAPDNNYAAGGLVYPVQHNPYGFKRDTRNKAFKSTGYAEGGAIDEAAHQAATSPNNDRPEPTEAQKSAGNYKKGPVYLHGMRLSIENPQGSTRSGTDADGNKWESELQHHYGYLRGTIGRDKDHIDVFLGPQAHDPDTPIHVVDQYKSHTGQFDEHKVMLGFPEDQDAINAYHSNYGQGWRGFGDVTTMDLPTFKRWAFASGRRVKPAAEHSVSAVSEPAAKLAALKEQT